MKYVLAKPEDVVNADGELVLRVGWRYRRLFGRLTANPKWNTGREIRAIVDDNIIVGRKYKKGYGWDYRLEESFSLHISAERDCLQIAR